MRLFDRPLSDYPRREAARFIAFLPQETPASFGFPAGDVVLMGRRPYHGLLPFDSEEDVRLAREAMRETDTEALAERQLSELSGGERQRVVLAAALAQEPSIMLLDEPTAALDLHYQIQINSILRRLNRERSITIVVVTHDHGDHLGDTVAILKDNPNAKFVAVYEIANYVSERVPNPDRVVGGNIGGPLKIPGIDLQVILTPAAHSSTRGVACGVVLKGKEATIYHAGDTGLIYDMALIGELYKPDIALLPIGGHFTMDCLQAAKAVELLKPKVVIPMHYNTFPLIKSNSEEFRRLVEQRAPQVKVVVLKPGEKYEF